MVVTFGVSDFILQCWNSNAKAVKMFEEISKMATKRRIMLVRDCLKLIMGSGQNALYWELRKLFAKTPIEAQCSVLKGFEFPKLQRHGWNEPIVHSSAPGERGPVIKPKPAYESLAIPPPPKDGSTVVDFSAAKMGLFRCMCEERPFDDSVNRPKEDEVGEEAEEDVGEEPKLKNKGEAKLVKEIESEESKIDDEEKELAKDPQMEDLVAGVV